MQWSEAPNIDEVSEVFIGIGSLKARIKKLKVEIDIKSINVKKENPRKPVLVFEATQDMQKELTELEADLDILEAKRDFLLFHKEMFKQYGYNNR